MLIEKKEEEEEERVLVFEVRRTNSDLE